MTTESKNRLNRALRQALCGGLQRCYAANWATHPACAACGKLHPVMAFKPMVWGDSACTFTTKCCDAGTRDWRFVVGTRKGVC